MRKTLAIFGIFLLMSSAIVYSPGEEHETWWVAVDGTVDVWGINMDYMWGHLDMISILIASIIVIGGAILSIPFTKLLDAFLVGFGTSDLPEERGLSTHDVFQRLSHLSVATGLIGVVIGLILMLQNLADPTKIGPAMAIALLTYFYGLVLSEVIFQTSAVDALVRTHGSTPSQHSDASEAGEGPLGWVRKLIGFAILIPGTLLALVLSGDIASFIDLPSLAVVMGFILFGILASVRLSDLGLTLRSLISMEKLPENHAIVGYLVFRRLAALSVSGGLIGTVIGLVKMLRELDDPTAIGPAMAVALTTILYGLLFAELCFRPLAADALARGAVTRDVGQRQQGWRLMASLGGVFMLLTVFFAMLIAMANFD